MRFFPLMLLLCSLLIVGCGVLQTGMQGKGTKYQYVYQLRYTAEKEAPAVLDPRGMLFQDDSIIIQFRFDDAAVHFQLQNLSESFLTVDPGKASIRLDQRIYPVRHSLNFYSDSASHPAIATLPPMTYIRDYMAPRENITFDGSKWNEKDLLPTVDRNPGAASQFVERQIGKTLALILPLAFGSAQKVYTFEFQVVSADVLPWKEYQPPKRSPPPPQKQSGYFVLDQVATGIIITGILGFSAYMLTLGKEVTPDLK